MRLRLLLIPLLALSAGLTAITGGHAAEVNLNTWGDDYTKVATGARDDVQFNLYRKKGDDGHVYLELLNRADDDVKVDLRLVSQHGSESGPALTGFVKAKGFWPNGHERMLAFAVKDPTVEIRAVTTGQVDEEQVVEVGDDGKSTVRYKYRFTSTDDLKRQARDKDKAKP